MNTDIMRRAGQNIMVNCDMFSGYTTACIISTEQRQDLVQGILNLVTPTRHCSKLQIRVDKAPALKSLAENQDQELVQNGITLELGEDLNKNSNCSVDKKIQELEAKIRRLCPKETKITTGILCQAVINLNNRVRNQGLTASQIHFSRDTNIGQNLHLDDDKLMQDKLQKRIQNHTSSAKSKAPKGKQHISSKIIPGQIVYARNDGSKHDARDPLLVTGTDGNKIRVQKILHSHTSTDKAPKITSQQIVADEKFLYVPPHRRNGNFPLKSSFEDSWWRGGDRPVPAKQRTQWVPTHRYDYSDDGDYGGFDLTEPNVHHGYADRQEVEEVEPLVVIPVRVEDPPTVGDEIHDDASDVEEHVDNEDD
jgi:hypothetical protein